MSANTNKFPHQKDIKKYMATADGACYSCVCAVAGYTSGAVIIAAANLEALEAFWNKSMPELLNVDGVQQVVFFDQKAVTLKDPRTAVDVQKG